MHVSESRIYAVPQFTIDVAKHLKYIYCCNVIWTRMVENESGRNGYGTHTSCLEAELTSAKTNFNSD